MFLLVFVQSWAGACDSRANKTANKKFHVSRVAENLDTAMYLLGVGAGALFAEPLSETFGRNPMYLVTTFCYMLFVLGTALVSNLAGQAITRFFVGLFAATTLTINGSSVEDMFGPLERSLAFPVIALANVAAPVIAPVAGGWIAADPSLAYAWTEWTTLIISAAAFVVAFLFLPETYPSLLIEYKTKHLRHLTKDPRYTCEHENESVLARLEETLPRPVTFFTKEPVVITLGIYLILLYIILFAFLSGYDYIFTRTYHFSTGLTGCTFAAVAAGAIFSTCLSPIFYLIDRRALQRTGSIPPETRLWPAIIASPFLPISLFWLGWTNYPSISPWSGLAACFVFGYALMAIYISSYQYIIDSYAGEAASALASITMARYIIAAGMVMATRPMYEAIGVHWVLTLLGCMGTVLAPSPLLFWKLGEKVRAKSKFAE